MVEATPLGASRTGSGHYSYMVALDQTLVLAKFEPAEKHPPFDPGDRGWSPRRRGVDGCGACPWQGGARPAGGGVPRGTTGRLAGCPASGAASLSQSRALEGQRPRWAHGGVVGGEARERATSTRAALALWWFLFRRAHGKEKEAAVCPFVFSPALLRVAPVVGSHARGARGRAGDGGGGSTRLWRRGGGGNGSQTRQRLLAVEVDWFSHGAARGGLVLMGGRGRWWGCLRTLVSSRRREAVDRQERWAGKG